MKKYDIHDAKVIIRNYIKEWVEFDARGLVLSQQSLESVVPELTQWKYACELDGPDAPNPLTAPCLPFPFTANELAAFMLYGVGAYARETCGNWENGPDAGMLNSMGVLAREPQKALVDAYAAYRQAERVVGKLDPGLEIRRNQLANEQNQQNLEANTREGVFEPGISRDEADMRRVRAVESTAGLYERLAEAEQLANTALTTWRKAMVNQLLAHPVIVLPAGTWKVDLIDIPTKIAESTYTRKYAEREPFRVLGEHPGDVKAREAAQGSEKVHIYALEREQLQKLRTAFITNKIVVFSGPGVKCDPDTDGAYLLLADFVTYVGMACPGTEVRLTEAAPAANLPPAATVPVFDDNRGVIVDAGVATMKTSWKVKTGCIRERGYRPNLLAFLKDQLVAHKTLPSAIDVLNSWEKRPPVDITVIRNGALVNPPLDEPDKSKKDQKVRATKNGIRYKIVSGEFRYADLKSINARIKNLTEASQ